jgi:hypothetical protein
MVGATAAALARGRPLREALVLGAAAGSGNFPRYGMGTGKRAVVEELAERVVVRSLGSGEPATELRRRLKRCAELSAVHDLIWGCACSPLKMCCRRLDATQYLQTGGERNRPACP